MPRNLGPSKADTKCDKQTGCQRIETIHSTGAINSLIIEAIKFQKNQVYRASIEQKTAFVASNVKKFGSKQG
eukprot:scaffold8732_cov87-Cylindrotheca_fusiformis.AAC.1